MDEFLSIQTASFFEILTPPDYSKLLQVDFPPSFLYSTSFHQDKNLLSA